MQPDPDFVLKKKGENNMKKNKYYMYKYAKNILKINCKRTHKTSGVASCLIAYLASTELIIEYKNILIVVMAGW